MYVLVSSCSAIGCLFCVAPYKTCAAGCFDQDAVQLQPACRYTSSKQCCCTKICSRRSSRLEKLFLLQERRARGGVRRKQAWERALPEDPNEESGEPAEVSGGLTAVRLANGRPSTPPGSPYSWPVACRVQHGSEMCKQSATSLHRST